MSSHSNPYMESQFWSRASGPRLDNMTRISQIRLEPDEVTPFDLAKTTDFRDPEKTLPFISGSRQPRESYHSLTSVLKSPVNRSLFYQGFLKVEANQVSLSNFKEPISPGMRPNLTESTHYDDQCNASLFSTNSNKPNQNQLANHLKISGNENKSFLGTVPNEHLASLIEYVLEHENNYMTLNMRVVEITAVMYNRFNLTNSACDNTIRDVLCYLLCWLELKFYRAVELLGLRKTQKSMFHSFLDLPSELLESINSSYQQKVHQNPGILTSDPKLRQHQAAIQTSLQSRAHLVGRNHSGCSQKSAIHRFISSLDSVWSLSMGRFGNHHTEALSMFVSVVEFAELPQTIMQSLRHVVSANYLLLSVEALPPISWTKEDPLQKTQLLRIDWPAVHANGETDELYELARGNLMHIHLSHPDSI